MLKNDSEYTFYPTLCNIRQNIITSWTKKLNYLYKVQELIWFLMIYTLFFIWEYIKYNTNYLFDYSSIHFTLKSPYIFTTHMFRTITHYFRFNSVTLPPWCTMDSNKLFNAVHGRSAHTQTNQINHIDGAKLQLSPSSAKHLSTQKRKLAANTERRWKNNQKLTNKMRFAGCFLWFLW